APGTSSSWTTGPTTWPAPPPWASGAFSSPTPLPPATAWPVTASRRAECPRRVVVVLVSLVAAVVAALCYGIATVMQAVAVRGASHQPAGGAPPGIALGTVDPGL